MVGKTDPEKSLKVGVVQLGRSWRPNFKQLVFITLQLGSHRTAQLQSLCKHQKTASCSLGFYQKTPLMRAIVFEGRQLSAQLLLHPIFE